MQSSYSIVDQATRPHLGSMVQDYHFRQFIGVVAFNNGLVYGFGVASACHLRCIIRRPVSVYWVTRWSGCLPTDELFVVSHCFNTCYGGAAGAACFFAGASDDGSFLVLVDAVIVMTLHLRRLRFAGRQAAAASSRGDSQR